MNKVIFIRQRLSIDFTIPLVYLRYIPTAPVAVAQSHSRQRQCLLVAESLRQIMADRVVRPRIA